MIGAIGPSLTRFAIEGRNSLPKSPFWPNESFEEYGGGDLESWGGPWWRPRVRHYWGEFFASIDSYGVPSAVWVMVVLRRQSTDPTPEQIKMFERLIRRAKKHAPGAEIVVSGMFEFKPWSLCPSIGPASYRASWQIIRHTRIYRAIGPDLHPLDPSNYNGPGDPCHQGPELRLTHGRELREYFG